MTPTWVHRHGILAQVAGVPHGMVKLPHSIDNSFLSAEQVQTQALAKA